MRTKIVGALGIVAALLAMFPSRVPAAGRLIIYACRDVRITDTGMGRQVTPTGCAREFSTSVPYVVLFMQVDDLDVPTTVAWQLLDPRDEVYAESQTRVTPPNAYFQWTCYLFAVLPVASSAREILERNPHFVFRVMGGGPRSAAEMEGQWKFRTSLDGRPTGTLTFTLKP